MNGAATKRTGSTREYRKERNIAYRRDAGLCRWCGKLTHYRRCSRSGCPLCFEADHLIHKSNGGSDHHTNLLTSCLDCNQARSTHETPRRSIACSTAAASDPMCGVVLVW